LRYRFLITFYEYLLQVCACDEQQMEKVEATGEQ